MINQPQLCTVRNHAGEIREVLSLTSSTALFHTITRDSLPVPFVHNGMNFALSFLQPLFHKQQRPAISYPFESQEEHFQRFQNTSDSLASRIPLLTPHSQYGGPIARDINISLASGFFGNPQHPTSFLFAPPPSSFYILLAPFDNNIYIIFFLTSFLKFIFPSEISPITNLPFIHPILSFLISHLENLLIFLTFYRGLAVSLPLGGSPFSPSPLAKSSSSYTLRYIPLSWSNI